MGGRGQQLRRGSPGPLNQGNYTNSPGFANFDTLKDALGTRGKPMNPYLAANFANPYYDGTYAEFSMNCQRAVIAYEARRRGYDVEAQPTYQGDKLPKAAYVNPKTGVRNSYWMGAFQNARPIAVGAQTGEESRRKLESQMKKFGEGSRAIMQIAWRSGGGHVINVEYRNGAISYNDAQVGERYSGRDLFKQLIPQKTQITRVDNLRFSERAKYSIEPAKRRTGKK